MPTEVPPGPDVTRGRSRWLVLLAGLAVIGLAFFAGTRVAGNGNGNGGTDASATGEDDATGADAESTEGADASIETCYGEIGLGADGYASGWGAEVSITNTAESTRDLVATVTFESEDGAEQYGSEQALVSGLAPGQSATATADAELLAFQQDLPDEYECRITSVEEP